MSTQSTQQRHRAYESGYYQWAFQHIPPTVVQNSRPNSGGKASGGVLGSPSQMLVSTLASWP